MSHEICQEDSSEDVIDTVYIGKIDINAITNDDFWLADINVNSKPTQYKLDSGSKITLIGHKTQWLNKVKLENCTTEFRGPGSVNLSHLVLGKITNAELKIQDRRHREDVFVMKNQPKNLLSKDAIKALRLMTPDPVVYNVEISTEFRKEFPELFKGLELLKDKYRISLQEEAVPVSVHSKEGTSPTFAESQGTTRRNGETGYHFSYFRAYRMVLRDGDCI